ncbi:uncharacterized protein LOC116959009 isoform X2 [Tyto alba]|uniref:uncharacterized protein LOC116959009 isoform X2 n=1 Tax=Tyto alba TaxID=56313 RepID=UPI001C66B0BF|nr:uncharacterized protein LOC116959009 isoform X2 [Tyto alba]
MTARDRGCACLPARCTRVCSTCLVCPRGVAPGDNTPPHPPPASPWIPRGSQPTPDLCPQCPQCPRCPCPPFPRCGAPSTPGTHPARGDSPRCVPSVCPPVPPQGTPAGRSFCRVSTQSLPRIVSPTMAVARAPGSRPPPAGQRDRGTGGHGAPSWRVLRAALWEATRVLMLLSVFTAAAGLALGFSVAASAARRARARVAGVTLLLAGLLALLGLAVYGAGTLSLLGPAGTAWRFSWSYILGWVAVVLTSSAGLFHLCAAAKDPSPESSEVAGT